MDFEAKAREVVASVPGAFYTGIALDNAIARALREAYAAGLREAEAIVTKERGYDNEDSDGFAYLHSVRQAIAARALEVENGA